MTKSTITRERLEELAAGQSGFNLRIATHEESQELARMALAAMDSEPVVWTDEEELRDANQSGSGYLFGIGHDANKFADPRRQIMLYCHAQPAPVVHVEVASAIEELKRTLVDCNRYNYCSDAVARVEGACRAAMLQDEPVKTANKLGNSPVIPDGSEDTKRLNWLDAQNKRLNEYYGTSYGWKFDANFQRNAMMLNDSNYPVMTVRQAIDEAIAAAPQEVK